MSHHIIFEGAELSGKSWVMSQIYNHLEPKYNTNKNLLDGCYWFNCDLGYFGTKSAPKIIEKYLDIFKELKDKNIIVEKFNLSNLVYDKLYSQINQSFFNKIDKKLKKLNFKVILLTFPENKELLEKRLRDRLNLYPNYERIAKTPDFYINQQKEYKEMIKSSNLDYLILESDHFPNQELVDKILEWLGEK